MTLSSTTFSVRVVSEPRNWTRKLLRGTMLTKTKYSRSAAISCRLIRPAVCRNRRGGLPEIDAYHGGLTRHRPEWTVPAPVIQARNKDSGASLRPRRRLSFRFGRSVPKETRRPFPQVGTSPTTGGFMGMGLSDCPVRGPIGNGPSTAAAAPYRTDSRC
jgi:hypothetical protein